MGRVVLIRWYHQLLSSKVTTLEATTSGDFVLFFVVVVKSILTPVFVLILIFLNV